MANMIVLHQVVIQHFHSETTCSLGCTVQESRSTQGSWYASQSWCAHALACVPLQTTTERSRQSSSKYTLQLVNTAHSLWYAELLVVDLQLSFAMLQLEHSSMSLVVSVMSLQSEVVAELVVLDPCRRHQRRMTCSHH
eukprot:TRINITY_DN26212_c0_g1_i2.p1 TRINITY_DN26212_c0_g1~~TRINITY_DN26212_c0_g1_i2.p1  ORF type:complete len:145 (+),score=3.44 TRINITY_DN26212_c0_g1_i2:24-437(+)